MIDIKTRRRNVKDIIRDEIHGAGSKKQPEFAEYILIPKKDVKKIAERIIKRTSIGPT